MRRCASDHRTGKKIEKSEDEIFGEMITKMIAGIPESEQKYLLKLRIQQDIVKIRKDTKECHFP